MGTRHLLFAVSRVCSHNKKGLTGRACKISGEFEFSHHFRGGFFHTQKVKKSPARGGAKVELLL